ncbi:hypothetical protein PJ267_12115 [Arthrobacter sp. OVS8]|nr:hypothetical protein PJ267_12115 [Arthrobacter sp. OVS8]
MAVRRSGHIVAMGLQRDPQGPEQMRVVVDYQDGRHPASDPDALSGMV